MKRKTGETARCPECGRQVSVIVNRWRDRVLERHTLTDATDYQYTNGQALYNRAAAPGIA